jgi:hypothetical protein
MAAILWSGPIDTATYRVVDLGAGQVPRLLVEVQAPPDAMGGRGWTAFEPIPRAVFEQLLLKSGVVR